VQCLLPKTWKSLQEHSDKVNYMEWPIFLFLFNDKHLVATRCFSWKIIFWEIEMYFWMCIWRYTSIVDNLIFLCFFVFVEWQISKELNIRDIYQSVVSRLKKRHHFNVNVWK
jgi:hypothetical protein